uniref:Septin-7 n=1 Tax=Sarcophilus harrisii TaxID=9305 RepID=A0A7N4PV26_SARHA
MAWVGFGEAERVFRAGQPREQRLRGGSFPSSHCWGVGPDAEQGWEGGPGRAPGGTLVLSVTTVIEEGGVKMKLTVIDTPGFGDQINNENCWEPIEKYINEQYEKFLKEEVNIARKKRIPDTRVHCCLYFISPTGHSLRPLDLEFMKHLSKVVNIVPIIAKADTMTLEEKMEFKQRVRKELEVNGIEFYPQKEFDEDLEDKTENDKIRQESMPFAVVGSDKEYQVNGKRVLGRKTPWGIIEVENLTHCEFALLRDFVIRTHLQDLKEVTHNIHYETYRARRLNDNGGLPPVSAGTAGSQGTRDACDSPRPPVLVHLDMCPAAPVAPGVCGRA